jgi:hypothetical protein
MIRPFRSPLPGGSHHLPLWCAFLPPNQLPASNLASNSRPDPAQNTTKPILLVLILRSITSSRNLSVNHNTIQFA